MACGIFYFHMAACKFESTVEIIKNFILCHLFYYLLTMVEVILLIDVCSAYESVMNHGFKFPLPLVKIYFFAEVERIVVPAAKSSLSLTFWLDNELPVKNKSY